MELWRYPLKSARGERVETVAVDAGGLRGDRTWACLDAEDGTVGSAKHPRRWGQLLEVGASANDAEGEDLPVTVHVGAAACPAGGGQADAALSAHLGRAVRLSPVVSEAARLHRLLPEQAGLVPDWMSGAGAGAEVVTEVAGARPGGRFVDFAAVHLVTTGALAGLARRLGRVDVAAGRFRPNLVLDAPADPEPGAELRLDDVVLRVLVPTPRCAVPGLDHGPAPADRDLLSVLARDYRNQIPGLGRAACFGVYAEVLQPGQVQVGQESR